MSFIARIRARRGGRTGLVVAAATAACALLPGAALAAEAEGCLAAPTTDDGNQCASGVMVDASLMPVLRAAPWTGSARFVVLAYPEGTSGPLDPLAMQKSADVAQPAPYAGCDLIDPEVVVYYEPKVSRYGYWGPTGGDCPGQANVNLYCYAEIWRNRDYAMIDNDSRTGNENTGCYVGGDTGLRYSRRTKHYAKGAVQFYIRDRSYWGYGPGPRGWQCNGQGTKTLSCKKTSPSKS